VGRPILLHQRIPLPASTATGVPGQGTPSDPSTISPPEDMQIDYIYFDEERGLFNEVQVRPTMAERQFWPTRPVTLSNYNNVERAMDSPDYGEFWLNEPYVLPRKHAIGLSMQNRNLNEAVKGLIMFQGIGQQSKRPYDLVLPFDLAAGVGFGQVVSVGGREGAIQAKEDVAIHALTWARAIDSVGWNPRLIGLQVEPSYGSFWSAAGSTVGAVGRNLPPLTAYSNVRGPRVGAFYAPPGNLVLEQGDSITFEFFNMQQAPRVATLTMIGTALASIKTP
jgi:hypothetical protein